VRERVFPLTNAPWTDKKNCFLAQTIIAVIVTETHFLDLSCNNFYDTVLDSFLETKVWEWIVTKFGLGGGVTNAKKKRFWNAILACILRKNFWCVIKKYPWF
jgi:hypothetical protein